MIVSLDCTTQENGNADTTLEYENEPSPEVFQEAKIYSYAEVVVRITDDSPSIAQRGQEELTSSVKRIIQEVLMNAETKLAIEDQPRMLINEFLEVE